MTEKNYELRAYRDDDLRGDCWPKSVCHQLEHPNPEARFALAIMERWAMVQGKDSGEDSAGRAKIDLMPVENVIERALEIADGAYKAIRAKDWMIAVPTLDELQAEIEARQNGKESNK